MDGAYTLTQQLDVVPCLQIVIKSRINFFSDFGVILPRPWMWNCINKEFANIKANSKWHKVRKQLTHSLWRRQILFRFKQILFNHIPNLAKLSV